MTLFQIDKIWPVVSTLYFFYCIILTILYLLGPFQNKTKQSSFRKGDTLDLVSTFNRKWMFVEMHQEVSVYWIIAPVE